MNHFLQSSVNRFRHFYLSQDSEEWKDLHDPTYKPWQFSASIIADIVGLGYKPACTRWKLMKGLLTPENTNYVFEYGKRNEAIALRNFYHKHPELVGVQPGYLHDAEYDFLTASLDNIAVTPQGNLLNVEVKCPFNQEIPMTASEIKNQWLIQINMQMRVSGIRTSVLTIWTPAACKDYLILYNENLANHLIQRVLEFRNSLQGSIAPRGVKPGDYLLHLLKSHKSNDIYYITQANDN